MCAEMTTVFAHEPVLLDEVIAHAVAAKPRTIVDCTVGGAGHSAALLEACPEARLIALDRDHGGLFADRLASLYAYFFKELVALTVKPSGERIDRLITMVETLHNAWREAADGVTQSESAGVHVGG